MSLTAEFHRAMADSRAATAIEFVFGDTFVNARKYAEQTGMTSLDLYAYALGEAKAIIRSLLESLGYCDHGPDRFDCEWALAHPELSEAADLDQGGAS